MSHTLIMKTAQPHGKSSCAYHSKHFRTLAGSQWSTVELISVAKSHCCYCTVEINIAIGQHCSYDYVNVQHVYVCIHCSRLPVCVFVVMYICNLNDVISDILSLVHNMTLAPAYSVVSVGVTLE